MTGVAFKVSDPHILIIILFFNLIFDIFCCFASVVPFLFVLLLLAFFSSPSPSPSSCSSSSSSCYCSCSSCLLYDLNVLLSRLDF